MSNASDAGDSGTETDEEAAPLPEREDIEALLADGIEEAHYKVTEGRVRSPERERVRQGWVRTLSYAAGQWRQLKREEDLLELQERVAELEAERERESAPQVARR